MAGRGEARQGSAGHGMARLGRAWQGMDFTQRSKA